MKQRSVRREKKSEPFSVRIGNYKFNTRLEYSLDQRLKRRADYYGMDKSSFWRFLLMSGESCEVNIEVLKRMNKDEVGAHIDACPFCRLLAYPETRH